MPDYIVITGYNCPYCDKAKELLLSKGKTFKEVNLLDDPEAGSMLKAAGRKTVPLILKVIGGFDDLSIDQAE